MKAVTQYNSTGSELDRAGRFESGARSFIETTQSALAPKTRRDYTYQWNRFEQWCAGTGRPSLPTEVQVVAAYLGHLKQPATFSDTLGRTRHRNGASASTIAITLAAIKWKHGQLPPNHPGRDLDLGIREIRDFTKGNRRERRDAGKVVNKAAPFTVEDWLTLRDLIGDSDNLRDIRDLALIGLGLVRALRGPSELIALDMTRRGSDDARGTFNLRKNGAAVRMHVTKTQADGDVDDRVIKDGPAVEAVRRWIEAAGIERGSPLWRPLKSNPRTGNVMIGQTRLSGRALHQIIRKRAGQVIAANEPDLSADEITERAAAYSTHSLRHGALTTLGNAGASMTELMELSRHSEKSAAIVMGYIRREAQGAEAMSKAGL
jgi:hypothetical protein